MDDDFFRREYDLGPQKKDNLFLWTICILLLMGVVIASWLGSFYIFGHPENPRNYHLLLKLHKIDPPKRFEYTAAPQGEFFTAQKIYEKYTGMPDGELAQENGSLLRDYIRNYPSGSNAVPYIVGQFTLVSARELGKSDVFQSGMVAIAQCNDYPKVLLEYIYTTDSTEIDYLKQMLNPGVQITPQKTTELSAVIHAEKLPDGRLLLTAVPIVYGGYMMKGSGATFSLEPPTGLHLEGGMPITKTSALPPAGKNYAAHPAPDSGEAGATPSAQLIGVQPALPVGPVPKRGSGKGPTPPSVTLTRETPTPSPGEFATPPPVPIAVQTPAPAATPLIAKNGTPSPLAQNATPDPVPFFTPPAMNPDQGGASPTPLPSPGAGGVALQPFIEAQPTPGTAATTWKVFKPGQMPRGRLMKISDAAGLADKGTGGEQLYLSGQFVVTASADNRAVLRAKTGVFNAINPLGEHTGAVRVLVEFPAGLQPPAEGATISRDEMRPFQIQNVQRERDGTVDVVVREITTSQ